MSVLENKENQPKVPKLRIIGDYQLGILCNYIVKTLGVGTFGQVKLAIHQTTGEKVAIKILEKEKIIEVTDAERVQREIHILKLIRHKHVIQLYEIIETRRHIFLVMEYANGGEFFEYIVDNQRLSELEACKYFQELISGIEYIHKLNIVHRDLKPENLLLDYNKSIKIVDFGLGNTYKDGEQLKTACGSPCYAAPEMISGLRYDSLLVDIWSCGVILFACVCGQLPFEDTNTPALYKKILSGEYTMPNFVSQDCENFLKGILTVDPKKRFNIEQIRNHSWFNIYRRRPIPSGIIVGYHQMPIDTEIVQQLVAKGFSEDYILKCIDANKHNNVTTAYFLLLKKHLMKGGQSAADINSSNFDERLLIPKARPLKPAISNLVNSQLLKTLKHNRSGSCQEKKSHTQQNGRGMSVPQVLEQLKTNKNFQMSTQSIQDCQTDDQRSKSFSLQNPNKKMATDIQLTDQIQKIQVITNKKNNSNSRSPIGQNKLLSYLKQAKKPTAVRGNSQQKMPFSQTKPRKSLNTTFDYGSLSKNFLKLVERRRETQQFSNLADTTNIQGKKSLLQLDQEEPIIPHTTKPKTATTAATQLWLQLNSRKGSRDFSGPQTSKTQKRKQRNPSFNFEKK